MPREGIFAKVTKGGTINVGNAIEVINDHSSYTDS
jgi:MOSC domain-containing protein YiiM